MSRHASGRLFRAEHVEAGEDGSPQATTLYGQHRETVRPIASLAVVPGSVYIAGMSVITSFGAIAKRVRPVRFPGAPTLTCDATKPFLPGAANTATVAGDAALVTSDAAGNRTVQPYQRADSTPLALGTKTIAGDGYREQPGRLILHWGTASRGSAGDAVHSGSRPETERGPQQEQRDGEHFRGHHHVAAEQPRHVALA